MRALGAKSASAGSSRKETAARSIPTGDATRVTISTFGALAGLAGIEHGVGEVLQGNVAPGGVMVLSWPSSELFRILAGEPAMTIVPNLLATGVLAILVSITFLVWATMCVKSRNDGLILLLLSALMFLVGGGFGPPILGTMVGVAATSIGAPLTWYHTHLSGATLRSLGALWPRLLVAGLIAWLSLLPGTILLDLFFGFSDPDLFVPVLTLSAFGLLLLAIMAAFARDVQRKISLHRTASSSR